MRIENLSAFGGGSEFEADVIIIGGGPAGTSIARELAGTSTRVLVLESGVEDEETRFMELNRLQSDGAAMGEAAMNFRRAYHGTNCASYDADAQPYGIRIRSLGGSARYWGGRSATFDETDFAQRSWVPHSGWPISRDSLKPYFDRAARYLNLGPNVYDQGLWKLLDANGKIERPPIDAAKLRSHFWQFARSKRKPAEMVNFADEFRAVEADNIRLLINATVVHINTDDESEAFTSLDISTIDGVRSKVRGKLCVLACGCVENARLLLASNRQRPEGLGNRHDVVGRYLMDHPGARIGGFTGKDIKAADYIGFYTLPHEGRLIMYTHGLTLSPDVQANEELHNAAVYALSEIAPDDPVEALKRLTKLKSANPGADLWALIGSFGLVIKGLGLKLFHSNITPPLVRNFIIDRAMAINPNFVVREFQSGGVPHKLEAIGLHVMVEQKPDPESRIVLSDTTDALGVPRVRVNWKISETDRRTARRFGELLAEELPKAGMPAPKLEDWVVTGELEDVPLIDMAHSIGATRMSDDPRFGVVDGNCQVHGVKGLYVAGGSVFPTSGQCNPTLMIVTLAVRLADRLKQELASSWPHAERIQALELV